MMCGSSRAFQKHIVLGALEDVLGGLWTSVVVGYFLAGGAPARTHTPVGGCTESRPRGRTLWKCPISQDPDATDPALSASTFSTSYIIFLQLSFF